MKTENDTSKPEDSPEQTTGEGCQKRLVRRSFRALGRDLYFDLKCNCPYKSDNPELAKLIKHTIKLSGYADDHFFDTLNAQPQEGVCKCGRKYRVQWFRDGVEAEFLPTNINSPNAERIHGGAGQPKPRDASTPLDGASC